MVGLAAAAIAVAGCSDDGLAQAVPSSTAGSPAATEAPTQQSPAGSPAALDERLRFTAQTVDGGSFDGASLAGKPAVLWFWAPWCPKCRAEADGVAEIARANGDAVTFVGVAALDEVPAMQAFVDQYDLDFTHVADPSDGAELWLRFGVSVQPAYAFVGADGSVEVVKSQLGKDELAGRVAALR